MLKNFCVPALLGMLAFCSAAYAAPERVGDFATFLGEDFDEGVSYAALRKAETVGRPVGSTEWLSQMEVQTGLPLAPAKRGRKPAVVAK